MLYVNIFLFSFFLLSCCLLRGTEKKKEIPFVADGFITK